MSTSDWIEDLPFPEIPFTGLFQSGDVDGVYECYLDEDGFRLLGNGELIVSSWGNTVSPVAWRAMQSWENSKNGEKE